MVRYIVTVEYDDGQYWISFPGIDKAGSHAKRVEDIVPHARAFLNNWTRNGDSPPASLDDAIIDPSEPFEGTKLVIFEWGPSDDDASAA
jgi:predicted RNase H-like HicB family nuclease